MCLGFMEFYPAGEQSFIGCQSLLDPIPFIDFLGGENYTAKNDNPAFDDSTLLYNGLGLFRRKRLYRRERDLSELDQLEMT